MRLPCLSRRDLLRKLLPKRSQSCLCPLTGLSEYLCTVKEGFLNTCRNLQCFLRAKYKSYFNNVAFCLYSSVNFKPKLVTFFGHFDFSVLNLHGFYLLLKFLSRAVCQLYLVSNF